jgi:hypothetical protein
MSAQLASSGVAAPNYFTASLMLAAGVSVNINAPTLAALSDVVGKLQATEAANDTPQVQSGKPAPAAKAAAPPAQPQTAGQSASAAAAQAGDAGNASASTATPASAQPAASGSASAGEAGNAAAAAGPVAAAPTASSSTPAASPEVTFEVLKKAFLSLSTKAGGRALCEGVLKPFALAKLSEAKPEQYAAVLAQIEKAAA